MRKREEVGERLKMNSTMPRPMRRFMSGRTCFKIQRISLRKKRKYSGIEYLHRNQETRRRRNLDSSTQK
jgi:hypothetical protein